MFHDDLLIGGTSGAWLKASAENGLGEEFRNHTGTVVLFRGDVAGVAAGATGTTCLDDDDASKRLISTNFGDLFGFAVTAIGDLDGDNFDEFLVGAPRGPFVGFANEEAPWEGRVYLYLSKNFDDAGFQEWTTSDWPQDPLACRVDIDCQYCDDPADLNSCDFPGWFDAIPRASAILVPPPLDGLEAGPQYFGFVVERIGDMDGDGTEDFAIGAPGRDNRTANPINLAVNEGRCYLISGAEIAQAVSSPGQETLVIGEEVPNGSQPSDYLLLLGDLTVDDCRFGGQVGDRVGHAISGNVDLDGDGDLDLAIGAPQYRWVDWTNGIQDYSVQCSGPGRVIAVAGEGTGLSSAPEHAILAGSWFLDTSVEFPGSTPETPDYGEGFGFSISTRTEPLGPNSGDPWGSPASLVGALGPSS